MPKRLIKYKQRIDGCLRIGIDNVPYIPLVYVKDLIDKIRREEKRKLTKNKQSGKTTK